jgi:hypothetical protein
LLPAVVEADQIKIHLMLVLVVVAQVVGVAQLMPLVVAEL